MADLFSPYVELVINDQNQVRNQFQAFDLWLSRKEPCDLCDFTLKAGLPDLGLVKDMPVKVLIGYDLEQLWPVFSGYVVEPVHPRYLLKDECLKLFRTEIVQTFLDVTPQDVIKYGLRAACIADSKLDLTDYPHKDRFVAAENASDIIRRVNATWGLGHDWYFKGKTFCWDVSVPQPGTVYSYRYGENIIELEYPGETPGCGSLITVISPFVEHSQEIEIIWPGITNTRFMVETVRHFLNGKGSWRSEIHFRELEEA